MDSHGVPQKINRHVFKAVNFLGDCSNFSNIYSYVKTCTQNLRPVPQLKETVRKSLYNLKSVGIIKMDARSKYYKLKTKFPSIKDDNNKDGDEVNNNLTPQKRTNKRHHNMDSDDDVDNEYDEIENVSKRFKASTKNISRTRVPIKKLPKHRRYNLKQKNTSKLKQPETSSSSKANIIYKKNDNITSDDYVKDEPNTNDKDMNNNNIINNNKDPEKEICYNVRTDDDHEKMKENNDSDVILSKSVSSKMTVSNESGVFGGITHEPDEQLTNDINNNNESPNIKNECPVDDDTLGIIRRYNFNYLN